MEIRCYPRPLGLLPDAQLPAFLCGVDGLLVCEAWHTVTFPGSTESVEDGTLASRRQIVDTSVEPANRLLTNGRTSESHSHAQESDLPLTGGWRTVSESRPQTALS
jgi:hypothetical protein